LGFLRQPNQRPAVGANQSGKWGRIYFPKAKVGAIASYRDQNNQTTSKRCDRWKRIIALTDAKGSVTRYDYTPRGQVSRIVAPDGGVEQFVYNREGALTSRIGQEGQTTEYLHTAFDLLVQAQDANGRYTSFVYDGATRLTQIINAAGHTWNYRYDQAGQLAAETDWAGRTTTYTRDALGRVTSKTLPDGVVQRLTWDAFDRIAEVATPNQRISYEYDPSDRLSRVCTYQADEQEPESRSRYTYDQAGRLSQEIQNGQTIRYRYDELGRMIERTTPSGGTRQNGAGFIFRKTAPSPVNTIKITEQPQKVAIAEKTWGTSHISFFPYFFEQNQLNREMSLVSSTRRPVI
jgi:YD repeat-containing protein